MAGQGALETVSKRGGSSVDCAHRSGGATIDWRLPLSLSLVWIYIEITIESTAYSTGVAQRWAAAQYVQ